MDGFEKTPRQENFKKEKPNPADTRGWICSRPGHGRLRAISIPLTAGRKPFTLFTGGNLNQVEENENETVSFKRGFILPSPLRPEGVEIKPFFYLLKSAEATKSRFEFSMIVFRQLTVFDW